MYFIRLHAAYIYHNDYNDDGVLQRVRKYYVSKKGKHTMIMVRFTRIGTSMILVAIV
jgi:hypothetical protein